MASARPVEGIRDYAVTKSCIGQNMEVYVDDLLVKSKEPEQHVEDLREAFGVLRQHKMKLNPTKCAFRECSGKFWISWFRREESKLT